MTPGSAHAVVHALVPGAALRADKLRTLTADLEVNSMLGGIKLHFLDNPWRLQPQRAVNSASIPTFTSNLPNR